MNLNAFYQQFPKGQVRNTARAMVRSHESDGLLHLGDLCEENGLDCGPYWRSMGGLMKVIEQASLHQKFNYEPKQMRCISKSERTMQYFRVEFPWSTMLISVTLREKTVYLAMWKNAATGLSDTFLIPRIPDKTAIGFFANQRPDDVEKSKREERFYHSRRIVDILFFRHDKCSMAAKTNLEEPKYDLIDLTAVIKSV